MQHIEQPTEIQELQKRAFENSSPTKQDLFSNNQQKTLTVPFVFVLAVFVVFIFFTTSIQSETSPNKNQNPLPNAHLAHISNINITP